jgi:iron complex transport system substrate-binding protein
LIDCLRYLPKLKWGILLAIIQASTLCLAAPLRIVSINPCLDQILVEVADPEQIAALSHYSSDPRSSLIVDQARHFQSTFGSAEEVIKLKADLVLASEYSSKSTLDTLHKLQFKIARFELPNSLEISEQQVLRIAELVGHPERGTALNQRIQTALENAKKSAPIPPLTALVYQANGFVAGTGTLIDQVMTQSGFINQAKLYGISQWGIVHLEDLFISPPKILFTPDHQYDVGAWSSRLISHPIFTHLPKERLQAFPLPEALIYCGGPTLIPLAKVMAQAHTQEFAQQK